jgi:hypothetical protein
MSEDLIMSVLGRGGVFCLGRWNWDIVDLRFNIHISCGNKSPARPSHEFRDSRIVELVLTPPAHFCFWASQTSWQAWDWFMSSAISSVPYLSATSVAFVEIPHQITRSLRSSRPVVALRIHAAAWSPRMSECYSGVESLEVMQGAHSYNSYLLNLVMSGGRGARAALDFGVGVATFASLSRV